MTVEALAKEMTQDYFDNLKTMAVEGIDHFPYATQHIPEMQEIIATLIEKGYAYPLDGDVYFCCTKDEDYGKLSGRSLSEVLAGTRAETHGAKQHPADFALWKSSKLGEPAWPSPWGPGRPGWHIECSAMAKKILGDSIDIHGGGLDLMFPHHENELAQSESCTGKPFARYWMHNDSIWSRCLQNWSAWALRIAKTPARICSCHFVAMMERIKSQTPRFQAIVRSGVDR